MPCCEHAYYTLTKAVPHATVCRKIHVHVCSYAYEACAYRSMEFACTVELNPTAACVQSCVQRRIHTYMHGKLE